MSLARLVEIMDNHNCSVVSLTRTADTTAYAANDVVGNATTSIWTFSVSNNTGANIYIANLRFKIAVNAIPSGMDAYRLHLYSSSPANIADNVAWNLPAADLVKYKGYIDISKPNDFGDNLFVEMSQVNKKIKLADGSQNIYGMLQTMAAYTPSSGAIKTIELETVGC